MLDAIFIKILESVAVAVVGGAVIAFIRKVNRLEKNFVVIEKCREKHDEVEERLDTGSNTHKAFQGQINGIHNLTKASLMASWVIAQTLLEFGKQLPGANLAAINDLDSKLRDIFVRFQNDYPPSD